MPCARYPGMEIVRGTITKTRLQAEVNIGHPDPVPAGRLSHLYVKIEWRGEEQEERNVTLRFRSLTEQGGRILFNGQGASGAATRAFTGNVEQNVAVYGERATVGSEADVILEIVIDEETRGEGLRLSVRQPDSLPGEPVQVLRREMEIALRHERPGVEAERRIWDRYNGIFNDARNFADALAGQELGRVSVPLIDGNLMDQQLNMQEVTAHLRSHRDLEGPSCTKALGKNNAFDLFQGHWRGNWREKNSCGVNANHCRDHVRNEAERFAAGNRIYIQNVVMGPDSRPHGAIPEGGAAVTCFSLESGRDTDTPAINAINIEKGVIMGTVGVKSQPDDDGVQSWRPHIGFYMEHGKLLWVAEEGREEDVITYSVFQEWVLQEESEPIGQQRCTILGFQFGWDRNRRQIRGRVESRGGQYRKLLPDAERRLEQDFRDRRLAPPHLENMRYRRRLEFLQPAVVQAFIDNPVNADRLVYLRALLEFSRRQEALRKAPLGIRESITFIMGANDPFYDSASDYFELNPTTHVVPLPGQSLRDARNRLNNNRPGNGRPWGEVNIVSHANEWGVMAIPVVPGGQSVHQRTLQQAMNNDQFDPIPDAAFDVRTQLHIRGCAIGRQQSLLTLMSRAFGGTGAQDIQRPQVFAPKFLQQYRANRGAGGDVLQADQFLAEYWNVVYPANQAKTKAERVALFQGRHGGVADWDDGLSRRHPRFNGDLYYKVFEGDHAVTVPYTLRHAEAATLPDLSTAQARTDWLNDQDILVEFVQGLGLEMTHLQWTVTNDAAALTTRAEGRGILVSVQRFFTAQLNVLFRIAGRFVAELDARTISNDLRSLFSDNDRELSRTALATIQWRGNEWLITDPERPQTYALRRDGGEVIVHAEGAPTPPPAPVFNFPASQANINALNAPMIPNAMRQGMEANGIPVPLIFYVFQQNPANERWIFKDSERTTVYALSRVGGQIHCYREPYLAHPPVSVDQYFGSEIPARPPEQDWGENILP